MKNLITYAIILASSLVVTNHNTFTCDKTNSSELIQQTFNSLQARPNYHEIPLAQEPGADLISSAIAIGYKQILDLASNKTLQNYRSKNQQTHLHIAAKNKDENAPEMIEYLVKKRGLDIHEQDIKGNKPIMKARTIEMLKKFLELETTETQTSENRYALDLIGTTNKYGKSLLHKAVKRKKLEIVKYLLKNGLIKSVNKKTTDSQTPLFYACQIPDPEIANILINAGAKVDEKDINGYTPFMRLVKLTNEIQAMLPEMFNRHVKLLKLLFDNGANINAKDDQGNTAVNYINLNTSYYKELFTFLAHNGADINNKGSDFAPLVKAVVFNFFCLNGQVPHLIGLGADWGSKFNNRPILDLDIKFFAKELLPSIFKKLTGRSVKLPFKDEMPSVELLKAFVELLKNGELFLKKGSNSLENLCFKFLVAFDKKILDNELMLTNEEKQLCDKHFTMRPFDLRKTVFTQEQHDSERNETYSTLSLKQSAPFKKEFLHDIKIKFLA